MTATAAPQPKPKPDNLFGVCAALGEDFGFDPLWLRVALGAGILWNPLAMLAIYASLGALVLAARLLFPNRKPQQPARGDVARQPAPVANDQAAPALAA